MNPQTHRSTLKKQPDSCIFAAKEMDTYIVLLVLFLLVSLFQPNRRVLKTVLENIYLAAISPCFNMRKERKSESGSSCLIRRKIKNGLFWNGMEQN